MLPRYSSGARLHACDKHISLVHTWQADNRILRHCLDFRDARVEVHLIWLDERDPLPYFGDSI